LNRFELRPASASDYELVWTIQRTSIGPYVDLTFGASEDEQRAFFDDYFDHRDFEIVQVGGRDAGFLSFETRDAEVYLGHIALLPDFQNQGIGAELVRHVIDHAEDAGLPVRLRVIRSNPARRFYERLGFSCYGETGTHFLLERRTGPVDGGSTGRGPIVQ
jgi:GNAT superfamily N-acetyltransferase